MSVLTYTPSSCHNTDCAIGPYLPRRRGRDAPLATQVRVSKCVTTKSCHQCSDVLKIHNLSYQNFSSTNGMILSVTSPTTRVIASSVSGVIYLFYLGCDAKPMSLIPSVWIVTTVLSWVIYCQQVHEGHCECAATQTSYPRWHILPPPDIIQVNTIITYNIHTYMGERNAPLVTQVTYCVTTQLCHQHSDVFEIYNLSTRSCSAGAWKRPTLVHECLCGWICPDRPV